MNLYSPSKNNKDLRNPIITKFANDYLNYINVDILKAISFYYRKNMQPELYELQAIVGHIFNNISEYLTEIILNNNAKNITRLGGVFLL